MTEVTGIFGTSILGVYNSMISTLPLFLQKFLNLFLIVLLVVIYAIFIWKFYRFIARKNLITLNLSKYNTTEHPVFSKFLAGLLYLLEYILILPLIVFIWFSIFTLFLIFLTENLDVANILLISAVIVAAIRMISYYSGNLSKDLAKLLPLTLLGLSMTRPNFFSIERILNNLSEIPSFFGEILIYLAFIIILEIILRLFDFIFSLFKVHKKEEIKEEKIKN